MRHSPLTTNPVRGQLFDEFLAQRAPDFTAATYSLLRHNCNHFTEEAAQFLVGRSIPESIRLLPERILATPFGPLFTQMFEGSANNFDPLAAHGGAILHTLETW